MVDKKYESESMENDVNDFIVKMIRRFKNSGLKIYDVKLNECKLGSSIEGEFGMLGEEFLVGGNWVSIRVYELIEELWNIVEMDILNLEYKYSISDDENDISRVKFWFRISE